jgi:hypothetical protein
MDDNIKEIMEYEAAIVEDWPDGMQGLVDKGIVKVTYGFNDKPVFSLTPLGKSVLNEIDTRLN